MSRFNLTGLDAKLTMLPILFVQKLYFCNISFGSIVAKALMVLAL